MPIPRVYSRISLGLLSLGLLGYSSVGTELARFFANDFHADKVRSVDRVVISPQPVERGSAPMLVVEYQGEGVQFVPLFTVPRSQLKDGRWLLTSRAEAAEGTDAGLAIQYYFGDAAPVSSRTPAGPGAWYTDGNARRTLGPLVVAHLPWYTVPDYIELGLEFNGPGSVQLELLRLARKPDRFWGFSPDSLPVAGVVLLAAVLWALLAPVLATAPRLGDFIPAAHDTFTKLFAAVAILAVLGEAFLFLDDGPGPGFACAITCGLAALFLKVGQGRVTARHTVARTLIARNAEAGGRFLD